MIHHTAGSFFYHDTKLCSFIVWEACICQYITLQLQPHSAHKAQSVQVLLHVVNIVTTDLWIPNSKMYKAIYTMIDRPGYKQEGSALEICSWPGYAVFELPYFVRHRTHFSLDKCLQKSPWSLTPDEYISRLLHLQKYLANYGVPPITCCLLLGRNMVTFVMKHCVYYDVLRAFLYMLCVMCVQWLQLTRRSSVLTGLWRCPERSSTCWSPNC